MSARAASPWKAIREATGRAVIPTLVGLAVFTLLAIFAGVDPPRGVTFSGSPFTDEAWNVLNARNVVMLGRWSTDDWNRQLVSVPFSLLHAAAFLIGGVGIIQARLVEIGAVALTAFLMVAALRRPLGVGPAVLGAIAFASSSLVLYYGRLVYLEPLTGLALTGAAVAVLGASGHRPAAAGMIAGVAIACAMGTKLLAAPAVAGMVGAILIVGIRDRACWRWLGGLLVALVLCVLLWGLVVWLPNREIVAAMARTWPPESLPASLGVAVSRLRHYLANNDGALGMSAPLLVGAALGTLASIARWRHLTRETRLVLAAAMGWALAGFGLLAIVPYAPNRYVVPALPPLGILVAVGGCALAGWASELRAWPRAALPVAGLVAAVLLAAPGLSTYAGWMQTTPSTLPGIQDRVRALIPEGAVMEGSIAPLLAMRADATTIITNFGSNPGDLYATRGVRWYVGGSKATPSWAPLHPEAWAARNAVLCVTWNASSVCIYRLPPPGSS